MSGPAPHPFHAVLALAHDAGPAGLRLLEAHAGQLVRLYCDAPAVAFRLETDPASAIDRQTFDYHGHVRLAAAAPPDMLNEIRRHLAPTGPAGTAGDRP